MKPHPDTRIIVSALPDDKIAAGQKNNTNGKYYYGCDTCLATSAVPRVEVLDFQGASAVKEAETILHALFDQQKRQLTSEQWIKVMDAVSIEPTALYLNLAMYVTTNWCSFDGISKELRGGIADITEQILEGLERDYGRELTRAALGFITWSVQGISDVEMEDLLSLHTDVLTIVLKYCPGVVRLPSHVWLRLRGALQGLLVEQNGGCLKWYHRQLREAAQRRYGQDQEEKCVIHALMGVYFGDLVEPSIKEEKQIHRQLITTVTGVGERKAHLECGRAVVVGSAVWTAPVSQINHRRAVEACVHLLAAKMVREAIDEICSLERVYARFMASVGSEIIGWLVQLQALMSASSVATADDHHRVDHYRRWLLRDASTIQNNPKLVLGTGSTQPKNSIVHHAVETMIVETPLRNAVAHDNASSTSTLSCYIGSRVMGGYDNFDALLSVLSGHTRGVTSVSCSPDGTCIVSGSWDNTVRVWEVATGTEVVKLEGHTGRVNSASWSPDGTRIVSGSYDNTVRVWEVATGTEMMKLKGHTDDVTSASWSPDGTRIISGSEDETVRVWEVATGADVVKLEGHTLRVISVSWSPDGARIVSGSGSWDFTVRVWDVTTGIVVMKLEGHSKDVTSVSWSPDGSRVVSGSYDKTVRVWDVAMGIEVVKLEGHTDPVTSVSWSPDGTRVVSGGDDNTARVWDVATGIQVVKLEGHTREVMSVSWSPDEARIVSGGDSTVRVWDVVTGTEVVKLEGHTNWVYSVSYSLDGTRIVSGSYDKTVCVWDVAMGIEVVKLEGHSKGVTSVSWSPDGTSIVSGSYDKTVRVCEVATGTEVVKLEGHTRDVTSVSWSPDGTRIVSGSEDMTVRVWEVATGTEVMKLVGHTGWVYSASWSPDGTRIVSGSKDVTVRLWDMVMNVIFDQ